MKKRQNNSARAAALQITLAVALLSVSAILFASSFKAAPQDGFYPPLPEPAKSQQNGFYPALEVPTELCGTFTNATAIPIPDSGPSSLYPSPITVSGAGGGITSVTVKLNSLNHTWVTDIDVLLVGPGGQNAIIMSDVGGSNIPITGVTLTLDDAAANSMPNALLTTGTYKPTNLGAGDTFPVPAPVPSGGSALSVFNSTAANGTWNLYVFDDAAGDLGSFAGGWELTISTDSCAGGTPTPTASPTASPTPTPTPTPVACTTGTIGENFDGVTAPALPSGWSASNASGAAPLWVTSAAGAPAPAFDTAPNAAFIDDPGSVSDKRLDSVPYTIANAGVQLTFRNNYSLENIFDGGVLEISIGGGAFTDIITAGGSFVTGGYNGVLVAGSPLAGRSAWTGIVASPFVTTAVFLPPAATGQTVVFRWRMGSDSSVSGAGWRIDGVSLNCDGGPTPTPGPTGTPTPTPTPTGTPFATCPPVITHSSSQAIVAGSVSCNTAGIHADNSYWRAFDMAIYTALAQYTVTSVSFGVELANDGGGVGQPVNVRLYAQTSGVFPGGTRALLPGGSTTATVLDSATATVLTVPLVCVVPAGTTELIMEVNTPDGAPGSHSFFIGSNAAVETGPSYISAASCGIAVPTTTAAVGFPLMHIILNVNGTCGATPTPGPPTPTPTASPTPTPTPTPTGTPGTPPTVCVLPVEDFADITTLLPNGWFTQNNSQPLGVTGWFQGSTATFVSQSGAPNAYIAANFQNGAGLATQSNWLLTPPLTLQTNGQLSFWTRTVAGSPFPDRLQVRMSTNLTSTNVGTLATDVGDFTTLLLDINPTYTVGGYPSAWTNFIVTLPAVGPVKGRLAFRYFVENGGPSGANGNYIGIDTAFYDCNGGIPTPTPTPIPPTPTPTPTPTGTPGPTATPCPGGTKTFAEFFDSVGAPALPAGWVAANAINPDAILWVTSSAGVPTPVADTAPNAAFINDPALVSDKRLDSPSIAIASAFAQLTFKNNYSLENTFDGGVLEISIAAGAFTDILTAGGTFVTGGYSPGTISTAFASPIAGRSAWTGIAVSPFVTTVVNLPAAAAGQNIQLRWRMGSDNSVSGAGWRIDGVSIFDCPTSTPTPTPTPPPLDITGTVIYCTNPALPAVSNVTMSLTGAPPAPTSVLTNGSGVYTLTGLTNGASYTVTPTKAAKPPGTSGINTSDSIAIQRHFLVIGTPLTGCRLLAADTNDPANGVTTTDAIAAQRFFLGLTTGIAQTGRYKFSPVSRAYAPLTVNQTTQDFNAVILGDAATAFVAPRPGGPEPDAAIENEVASTVESVTIDRAGVNSSAIDAKSNLVGFQGDFTFDERVVTVASQPVSNAGLTAGNWNVSGNVMAGPGPIRTLRVSAFSLDGAPLSGTGVLFNVNMINVDKAAPGAPLAWASAGEPFVFIDADLNTQRPGHGAAQR